MSSSTCPHSRSSDRSKKWSNLIWLLGYLLIGIAGLHGSNLHEKSETRQRSRPLVRRLISVGLILLALPGALVLDAMTGDGFEGDEWAVFATAFVLVLGLIVARAMILITEIEQSRARNRRMRLRLQTVFESAGVGIVIRESDYMTETNSAFQTMLGYTGEELAGLRFFDIVHPDDLEDATAATKLEIGARSTVERRFIHHDGSTVLGRVTQTTASEERLHIAVIEDITMKAHQERQIQEGQKLEAIGRLAGGIAHDFNNLLTAVNGHAELIRLAESRDEVEESANIIIEASGRAASPHPAAAHLQPPERIHFRGSRDGRPAASHRCAPSPSSAGLGPDRASGKRRCALDRRRPNPDRPGPAQSRTQRERCNARRRHAHALGRRIHAVSHSTHGIPRSRTAATAGSLSATPAKA